ncbi:FixH family protein [Microbulbifer litoralis]|uniref:FixH family protein n=1 Tax=Microbulbifer litoralis TaxID=2933965 RepID=UPI0020286D5B|nr:FixH family protein [Microbulbifer sp. GX H0434]
MTEESNKPWYREFWLWVVLFPLILTLVASSIMVTIAVRHADDTVSDTYYKDSRMYHYTAEQDERARALGLAGMLQFRRADNVVTLDLDGELDYPEKLLLTMSHPVEEDMDRHILLELTGGGHYTGTVPGALQHRWYLRLMPELSPQKHLDAEWRLKGEINFDLGHAAPLNPAVRRP